MAEKTFGKLLAAQQAQIPVDIESDIRQLAVVPQRRSIGNSADMNRIEELLSNGVTAAHDDTCAALDNVMNDAKALLDQADRLVESHKTMLREEGQRIARTMAAAVQELTRTVKWLEEQGPKLRNPQLEPPKPAETPPAG